MWSIEIVNENRQNCINQGKSNDGREIGVVPHEGERRRTKGNKRQKCGKRRGYHFNSRRNATKIKIKKT